MTTNLQIGFNSATYTMNGTNFYGPSALPTPLPIGQFQSSLSVACTGGSCGPPTTMSSGYAGSFTGANALGIAMIYHVVDTGGNGDITGARGFKR
jgi:hypothetical protein